MLVEKVRASCILWRYAVQKDIIFELHPSVMKETLEMVMITFNHRLNEMIKFH